MVLAAVLVDRDALLRDRKLAVTQPIFHVHEDVGQPPVCGDDLHLHGRLCVLLRAGRLLAHVDGLSGRRRPREVHDPR